MKKHTLNIQGTGTIDELVKSLETTLNVLRNMDKISKILEDDDLAATLTDGVTTTKIN